MNQADIKINEIKSLYDQLKFNEETESLKEEEKVEIYHKNQSVSERILELIEDVLKEDPRQMDALFWKIKIYNGPYFEDVSVMMSTAEEIIEKLPDNKKAVLGAYDWLAWCYQNKLELQEKSVEILHDKLIEISLIESDYGLKDREFGETYYLLALLYKELGETETAGKFYKLSFEHSPDHYYTTYQGGVFFLEQENYEDALLFLESFYIFHGNEYSVSYAKQIQELFESGKLENPWSLIKLMYFIGIDFPNEMGYKNARELGLKYLYLIDNELKINPENIAALRMKIQHYLLVDKNSKKAFELLQKYFSTIKTIKTPLYFTFYELAMKFNIDVSSSEYLIECDSFNGYILTTRFLEKAGELKDDGELELSLQYYKEAKEIGLKTIPIIENYFENGIGNKICNNPHGYAMLCNNLGIAIRNVVLLSDEKYNTEECKYALELHKRGYIYSPFWENMENGMRMAELMENYDEVEYFGKELLTYYEEFSISWMIVQSRLLKNMTNADRYEEAEEFYQKFKADFESKNIEDEEVIGEMIYAAAEYFTYIRYKKKDYIKSIELTENFFSNNKYFDLNEDVSKINYWFNLAWSYHGLKSREQAKKYFDLLKEHYGSDEKYTHTIEEIPREYNLSAEENVGFNNLLEFIAIKPKVKKHFNIVETSGKNEILLEKIIRKIVGESFITVETWIDDDVFIKIVGRHKTNHEIDNKENRFDSIIDLYLPKENTTIRYDLIETEEEIKGILGLFSKTKIKKELYVFLYHYEKNQITSESYLNYEDETPYFKALAQKHWNELVSRV